jgi:exopolysaccharide biosynthesis protein
VFRPKKTLKKTGIKLYNTLALPTLLNGSENWTIKARDATRITAADMKCMRITARYTCTDHKNADCKGIKYNPSVGIKYRTTRENRYNN